MTAFKATAAAFVAIATIAAPLMTATDANAGKRSKYFYSKTTSHAFAARGVEGFASPSKFGVYCSYTRVPIRRCWLTRRGGEVCKVVGWNKTQRCY
ncbi:MAG: hypothetical protein AAFQ45_11255 [Pseudomonadota bacterium]